MESQWKVATFQLNGEVPKNNECSGWHMTPTLEGLSIVEPKVNTKKNMESGLHLQLPSIPTSKY